MDPDMEDNIGHDFEKIARRNYSKESSCSYNVCKTSEKRLEHMCQIQSPDGDTELFDTPAGVLLDDPPASYTS